MKVKEKAEYLIESFKMDNTTEGESRAIRCALIAIDEIQEFIIKYDNHVPDFKYWESVRKEIEKL